MRSDKKIIITIQKYLYTYDLKCQKISLPHFIIIGEQTTRAPNKRVKTSSPERKITELNESQKKEDHIKKKRIWKYEKKARSLALHSKPRAFPKNKRTQCKVVRHQRCWNACLHRISHYYQYHWCTQSGFVFTKDKLFRPTAIHKRITCYKTDKVHQYFQVADTT